MNDAVGAVHLTPSMFIGANVTVCSSIEDAKTNWLRPQEVCDILINSLQPTVLISNATPNRPPSGSLYLYNKLVTKRWRNDSVMWQRSRGGARLSEHHENLKVDSVEVLNACYCRAEHPPTFRRRAYWLLSSWIESHVAQTESKKRHAEQVLQRAKERLQGGQYAVSEAEQLQLQHEASEAAQAIQAAGLQRAQYEQLSGVVLVHYLDEAFVDEAVGAALVLQKNVRALLKKRQRTESPPKYLHDEDVMLEEMNEDTAAKVLQSHYRGHHVRKTVQEESEMSKVLQKHVRGHIARKELAQRDEASHVLGKHVRGHLARKDLAKKDKAARVLGRQWRGRHGTSSRGGTYTTTGNGASPRFDFSFSGHPTPFSNQSSIANMERQLGPGPLFNGSSLGDMPAEEQQGQHSSDSMEQAAPNHLVGGGHDDCSLRGGSVHPKSEVEDTEWGQLSPASHNSAQLFERVLSDSESTRSQGDVALHAEAQPCTTLLEGARVQALQAEVQTLRVQEQMRDLQIMEKASELRVSKSTVSGLEQIIQQKDSMINILQSELQKKNAKIQVLQRQLQQAQMNPVPMFHQAPPSLPFGVPAAIPATFGISAVSPSSFQNVALPSSSPSALPSLSMPASSPLEAQPQYGLEAARVVRSASDDSDNLLEGLQVEDFLLQNLDMDDI